MPFEGIDVASTVTSSDMKDDTHIIVPDEKYQNGAVSPHPPEPIPDYVTEPKPDYDQEKTHSSYMNQAYEGSTDAY